MSDQPSLLPPNATSLERALEKATLRLDSLPVPLHDLWNPSTCPASLLPWLAWANSVDQWDAGWTEQERRDVIKASLYVHKRKGTIGALDRALRPLGNLIEVREWFEEQPKAAPYTFRVVIGTATKPVTAELYDQMERLIDSAKNLRSHLAGITIKADVRGRAYVASATTSGVETTVYPYTPGAVGVGFAMHYAAVCHGYETVTVRPQA